MTLPPLRPALSWNTHCLLTRAALQTSAVAGLDQETPVTALEDFLVQSSAELPSILSRYWASLAAKVGKPRRTEPGRRPPRTAEDFLLALGLKPGVPIHYVRTLRPEEMPPDALHNQSREGPPGNAYLDAPVGDSLTAREILATFSDEPDWGMDQDLFSMKEYGYGPAPLGFAKGGSSQAPFHMAFFHEGPVLRLILSRLMTSFLEERAGVFFALSRLASEKGLEYWAWRFTAWAMHYLQDLTQPYHARAIPAPLLPAVVRSLIKPGFRRVALLNRDYLRNRHLAFEAAVHFVLNDAVKKGTHHAFLAVLAGHGEMFREELSTVLRESSRIPARIAGSVDRATISLLDDSRLEDTRYSLESDTGYRIDQTFSSSGEKRPDMIKEFIELVSRCLEQTGRVTRYAVTLGSREPSRSDA